MLSEQSVIEILKRTEVMLRRAIHDLRIAQNDMGNKIGIAMALADVKHWRGALQALEAVLELQLDYQQYEYSTFEQMNFK